MPSVCFSGFPLGSVVSIDGVMTTSWGQMSEGETVWDLDPTPGISVEINARRSNLQAAPEAFQFDLTLGGFETNTLGDENAYDPSYHDKSVFWDYGDSYTFTAPEQVQSGNLDSRWSRGPLGAHTYRDAGDFVVRVAVIEPSSGRVGFGTFRIGGAGADTPRVQAASDVFEGAATLFVDTNGAAGGYPNAPAGATTYDNIQSALNRVPSALVARIVLERGQTHTIQGFKNMSIYDPVAVATMRLEANTGGGAKPILDLNPANFGNNSLVFQDVIRQGSQPNAEADLVFSGLDIRGLWDSTTETGAACTFMLSQDAGSGYVLFDDCEFTGWSIAYQPVNRSRATAYTFNDTVVTDWSGYAVLDGSSQVTSAYTGSRLTQHVDALSGGPQGTPTHNTQGPLRFSGPTSTNIWATDIFSRTGWFPHGDIYDIQPCVRFATSSSRPGARLSIGGSVLESAGIVVTTEKSESNGNQDAPINAMVDGNIILGGFRSYRLTAIGYGGTTWRNNFLIQPDVNMTAASINGPVSYPSSVFSFATSNSGSAPGNYTTPTLIYNNTVINLLTAANAAGGSGAADLLSNESNFTITYENNILHEPNRTTPRTLYGSTEVAPPDGTLQAVSAFMPRYNGYRDFDTVTTLDTTFATPADSGQIWVPQIGSPALGAALVEPNATTSFSGTRRPEPPSVGAAELE